MVGQPETRLITPQQAGLDYPDWYPQQKAALEWILGHQQRVLMLDAPTAVGKTGIAAALPNQLGTVAYAATESRSLQDQYHDETGAPVIKGRQNFSCGPGWEEGLDTCEFGYCNDDEALWEECPFRQQFEAGLAAPFTVLNYQVLLTYLTAAPKFRLPPREWLVCDEGHLLEEALSLHFDVVLDREMVEMAEFPLELPAVANKEALYRWALDTGAITALPASPHQKRLWDRIGQQAVRVLETLSDPNAVVQDHDDGLTCSARVLWPLTRIKERLLNHFNRVLIMSATLGDMDYLARQMGLSRDEYATLAVDSPIAVDRRLIYVVPVANLAQRATDIDYLNMASAIIEWAEKMFPRQKGIVHVTSFKMARRLGKMLQERLGKRVVVEDRRSPDIKVHWEKTLGGILVTPNSGTGFDRPYLFQWQVIAHLPYPSLAERVNRTRLNLDRGWFLRKTANRTVQMAGRVTRATDDTGLTIIADSLFEPNVWKQAKDSFPKWFRDALRWVRAAAEVE